MTKIEKILLSRKPFKIFYKGKEYKANGVVKLTTKLMHPDIYYKVKFEEKDVGMFFVPSSNDLFISLGKVNTSTIPDTDLGKQTIIFNGETFKLEAIDHQMVKEVIFGAPMNSEGECRFFDYYNEDSSKNLSLGWTFRSEGNNPIERDDVFSERVVESEFEIVL